MDKSKLISFADQYLSPYRIKYKGDGSELIPTYCPFCQGGSHNDENTFALSIEKGCYKCKRGSCNVEGSVEMLAQHFGVDPKGFRQGSATMRKISKTRFKLPDIQLQPPTDEIYRYFETRKISKDTVDAFRIGADKSGNIVFPFYENATLTFVKYRRPRKPTDEEARKSKEWRIPETKAILFNLDNCDFQHPLYITEGEIDAMSLYESGITNVVSVPSGCDDMSWIENNLDWLENFSDIVLFGDNDDPGRRMVEEVSKRLGEWRCRIVTAYPERPDGHECKDANEILYFLGPFAVSDAADSAEEIDVPGILDVGDIPFYDPSAVDRIKFGIPGLDEVLGGMEEGCITIISGKSSAGKSTLTNQIVLNAAEQNKKVVVYSGEMKAPKLIYWLSLQCAGSDYIGLEWDAVKGKMVPSISYDIQKRIKDWLRGKVYLFNNEHVRPEGEKEIDTVMRLFEMTARKYAPFLFVVDNVMSLVSDQTDENAAQRAMITRLKSFCQRFKCHIILIAHPRKSDPKNANSVMNKDSVSGSSSMVNYCDSAFSVEKPDIRILKNRDGGVERIIQCCYASDCRRIYQMDKGDVFRDYSWNKTGAIQPDEKANTIYGITMAEQPPPAF